MGHFPKEENIKMEKDSIHRPVFPPSTPSPFFRFPGSALFRFAPVRFQANANSATPARNENCQPPCFLYPSQRSPPILSPKIFPTSFRHKVIFLWPSSTFFGPQDPGETQFHHPSQHSGPENFEPVNSLHLGSPKTYQNIWGSNTSSAKAQKNLLVHHFKPTGSKTNWKYTKGHLTAGPKTFQINRGS
ncbi:hypothetical protein TNIN_485631 [Trichonephila inaurata madagascariensis]|uniref:Uncharacterized protein n=1 Tax=Trichonephila inaurata madagascariensis TaxID=2747483 RepID=A0A8X6MCV0_9ARAC|nr:hypothetical protein TNIN_485631 [Trichonephila inaurata madagascariensis]